MPLVIGAAVIWCRPDRLAATTQLMHYSWVAVCNGSMPTCMVRGLQQYIMHMMRCAGAYIVCGGHKTSGSSHCVQVWSLCSVLRVWHLLTMNDHTSPSLASITPASHIQRVEARYFVLHVIMLSCKHKHEAQSSCCQQVLHLVICRHVQKAGVALKTETCIRISA